MATATQLLRASGLHNGDRMSQEEFHRIYATTCEDFTAELIGGIVYVFSPLRIPHGTWHLRLGSVFAHYAANTRGLGSK